MVKAVSNKPQNGGWGRVIHMKMLVVKAALSPLTIWGEQKSENLADILWINFR